MAVLADTDKLGGDRPDVIEAQVRFKKAIEDGLLKIMSKMGISDVASYRGAQLFEAIGLAQEVMDAAFPRTPSPVRRDRLRRARGGRLGARRRRARGEARAGESRLRQVAQGRRGARDERPGRQRAARDRRDGRHAGRARAAQGASAERAGSATSASPSSSTSRVPIELRDLLELVPAGDAVPLEEVESVDTIVKRFSSRRDEPRRNLEGGARDDRDRHQPARRHARTAARAARGRSATSPTGTRPSSRSPRAASASRPPTCARRTSCRSRSRRAPSRARAGSCRATRSRWRSRSSAIPSRAWR